MARKETYVDLGKHVLDKELADRNGLRAGKVDDILLEMPDFEDGGRQQRPEVVAIIGGPLALAQNMPVPIQSVVRWVVSRLLGIADPKPTEIAWSDISAIDVIVHVDVDRREVGLTRVEEAVADRLIGRLPGAGVRP